MPIKLYPASESRVRTLRDSLSVFSDLLVIKLNIWRRRYGLPDPHRGASGLNLNRDL